MNRHIFLFAITLICAVGWGAGANSDGLPANEPLVVLKGERDSELGPHGQGNVYAADVLVEGNRYRMWYGGQGKDGHDRIHYAESEDGYVWVRKGVVLEDCKANHVNDPCVLKVGGVYYMYYTWTATDVVDRRCRFQRWHCMGAKGNCAGRREGRVVGFSFGGPALRDP